MTPVKKAMTLDEYDFENTMDRIHSDSFVNKNANFFANKKMKKMK